MATKNVDVVAVAKDLRAGMDDMDVMWKHDLAPGQLRRVKDWLTENGIRSTNPAAPAHESQTPRRTPKNRPAKMAIRKGGLRFQNPNTGYVEEIEHPELFVFIGGAIYFAMKGVWTHCVAAFVLALCTCGLSWFIYPLFAKEVFRKHYLRMGWKEV